MTNIKKKNLKKLLSIAGVLCYTVTVAVFAVKVSENPPAAVPADLVQQSESDTNTFDESGFVTRYTENSGFVTEYTEDSFTSNYTENKDASANSNDDAADYSVKKQSYLPKDATDYSVEKWSYLPVDAK